MSGKQFDDEQRAELIRILATTDAVWWPMRQADWRGRTSTVLYEHRKRYATDGIPWTSPSPDEAGRKASQRRLESMAKAGSVRLHGGDRRASVKLTEAGDTLARAIVGLPNIDAAHSLVGEVIRLRDVMVSELQLARLNDYSDTDACRVELAIVEEMAAPALCRGWLASQSDTSGRVRYAATALGRRIATLPEPALPDGSPESNDDASSLYYATAREYRERLRNSVPAHLNEIGYVPLPFGNYRNLKARRRELTYPTHSAKLAMCQRRR